jgi:RimJ/RimL family protein N-acetyltransferase
VTELPAPVRLTGHGLVLREWTADDLTAMTALFDDPDVARHTPLASPFDEAAARRYLHEARTARLAEQRLHLAVTEDGREVLGEVMLNRSFGSVGYVIGAAHRGRHLALRALRTMTEYAHHALALSRVLLEIEPGNHASVAVARAAGYRLTDAPPETVTDKGRTYHLLTWEHRAAADRRGEESSATGT